MKYHTYNNFKGYLVGNDLVDIELNGKKKVQGVQDFIKVCTEKMTFIVTIIPIMCESVHGV